jgi:methylenetetrahydrofolate dehydrogenase (NADP+)/methenyltetrahydrofolate cyclohydrolase
MTATLIDGREVAATLRRELAVRITTVDFSPVLAVVLVGDDPASAVYVRNKDRAAQNAGITARTIRLPAATGLAELLSVVKSLNDDADVDGILVQLPLPAGLDSAAVISAIDPAKDVDGLTPTNVGLLASGRPGLVPCTPLGVMKLLAHAGTELRGARAVVLGRSLLVGKPVAALLTAADATVTIAHSRTRDLAVECRRAEVLVAAVGKPELVRADWVANHAVVIDVGINRLADGRLVGDVATAECAAIASAITPVPGGVGPMTIACLLENTLTAALRRRGLPASG